MRKKVYKKLMLAGLLPWRPDVLKKDPIPSEEDLLLHDGWQYVNVSHTLTWRNDTWRLLYKIIGNAVKLPHYADVSEQQYFFDDIVYKYKYIEFKAVSLTTKRATLYAYGNFLTSVNKPYIMRGKQLIRA